MLTDFIKIRDVREAFDRVFPTPKIIRCRTPAAPRRTRDWGLVGRAFDYLLRFHIEHINRQRECRLKAGEWVAFWARHWRQPRIDRALALAAGQYQRFVSTGRATDLLLTAVMWLARADSAARDNAMVAALLMAGIGKHESPQNLADLRALLQLARQRPEFLAPRGSQIVMNPTFGNASGLVGGADADFILNETLVEVKTTSEMSWGPDYRQLVAYAALDLLERRGTTALNRPRIRYVDVYYARFGRIVGVPAPLIDDAFLNWLEERALRAHGEPRAMSMRRWDSSFERLSMRARQSRTYR